MIYLLDTNVLIALGWSTHQHHNRVWKWFSAINEFATCPITQLGFLRISMAMPGYAVDFPAVRTILQSITERHGHHFLACDQDFGILPQKIQGHQQITDQYLAAIAAKQGIKLATLDNGVIGTSVFFISE